MPGVSDISWGGYKEFEGPYYLGKYPYTLPDHANEAEKRMLVLTTTEGGTYDAYNGYDVCISTSGLVQWCDRAPFFLVCKVLGAVAEKDAKLLEPITAFAEQHGYSFRRNSKGGWRWFLQDSEVTTKEEQRSLCFAGASGNKGSFSDVHKEYAKKWAAAVSTVWESPEAQAVQRAYTLPRLDTFAVGKGKALSELALENGSVYAQVFRAAYTSFAANNPSRAAEAVRACDTTGGTAFSRDWLITMLRFMTFHPNIAIYPHRYDRIRPVLERLYAVDLPDFSSELKAWQRENKFQLEKYTDKGVQLGLLALGYDIGPMGADGVFGRRSQAALAAFEDKNSSVPPSHKDGMPDKYTVPALTSALEAKGLEVDLAA